MLNFSITVPPDPRFSSVTFRVTPGHSPSVVATTAPGALAGTAAGEDTGEATVVVDAGVWIGVTVPDSVAMVVPELWCAGSGSSLEHEGSSTTAAATRN